MDLRRDYTISERCTSTPALTVYLIPLDRVEKLSDVCYSQF